MDPLPRSLCSKNLESPHKDAAHHGHTVSTGQSQDLNLSLSDSLGPETTTTPAMLPCLLSQCGEEVSKEPCVLPEISETDSTGTVWVIELAHKC